MTIQSLCTYNAKLIIDYTKIAKEDIHNSKIGAYRKYAQKDIHGTENNKFNFRNFQFNGMNNNRNNTINFPIAIIKNSIFKNGEKQFSIYF